MTNDKSHIIRIFKFKIEKDYKNFAKMRFLKLENLIFKYVLNIHLYGLCESLFLRNGSLRPM